ncbi:MAG: tetratricopeptide repeat protein [Gammaproteobacteria bacterium]|nr:tetratricopeptide repeat protein [Gammaproteobacteria bacterium]
MSLLLDALKKAAQQKAQKSQPEVPEYRSSEETLIRAGADDISGVGVDETGSPRVDEAEFDHSEIRNRLESDLSQRIAGDETGFVIPHGTDNDAASSTPEPVTGDDTGLDIVEAVEVAADPVVPEPGTGDDTGLDIAEPFEVVDDSAAPEPGAGDETGLDIADVTESRLETDHSVRTDADETGLDIADITGSRLAESGEQLQTGDEEIIVLAGEDETDFSQPSARAEAIESALPQRDREPDEISADEQEAITEVGPQAEADEDLSLLLVDQTDMNARTSVTDRNLRPAIAGLTAGADDTLDGLGLVETDDPDTAAEQTDTESTAITNPTRAIGSADDTRRESPTVTQSTLTRAEATSTRTYAPDNYDRTLMRPPGEDASKIFAGMKSDSDVVMTPDYAKKVFRSKTSAQRAQHYKIYAGVAVVILLSITIFGAFEYQEESSKIDTSLRALKRDPMPGIISTTKPDEGDLFAATDAETSARTIEIIEGANEGVTATESVAVTEQPEAVAEVETGGAEVAAEVASAPLTEAEVEPLETQQTRATEVEPVEVAGSTQFVESESEAIESVENLHIVSSSQVSETDIWLHEAYGAYQSGDYRLAMKRYNEVLEVHPNNRNALLARAAINIHEGYSEAAIQDYRRLLLANPKDSLAMSSLLSVASYSPGEIETQLKLMIRDEPDSPYLNFALANAYGAQERWQEAQAYYFKALQNNPQDPNYAYNLAVSLEHISQPGSAIAYYRRALENFENGPATFSRNVVDQRLQLLGKL